MRQMLSPKSSDHGETSKHECEEEGDSRKLWNGHEFYEKVVIGIVCSYYVGCVPDPSAVQFGGVRIPRCVITPKVALARVVPRVFFVHR